MLLSPKLERVINQYFGVYNCADVDAAGLAAERQTGYDAKLALSEILLNRAEGPG